MHIVLAHLRKKLRNIATPRAANMTSSKVLSRLTVLGREGTESLVLKKESRQDNSRSSSSIKFTFDTKVTRQIKTTISTSKTLRTSQMEKYIDNFSTETTNSMSEGDRRSQTRNIKNSADYRETSEWTANAGLEAVISDT